MLLHYQTGGEGQPLVLIHGLFGSADNWGSIARHFSQHYQVISIDLRNHGRSPHCASQTYADMAADLLELCDRLELAHIHVLGHSLGGKVAMQFATQYPERVSKLIVVDMAMRAYADAHTPLIQAMLALDLTTLRSRSEAEKALSQTIPDLMVRQFLLTNLVKTGETLQWRINLQALKANYPALIAPLLASFAKPSLFIRGEHSDYVQESDRVDIQRDFPQATFETLPTGHWVHAEQPQLFIEAVTNFL